MGLSHGRLYGTSRFHSHFSGFEAATLSPPLETGVSIHFIGRSCAILHPSIVELLPTPEIINILFYWTYNSRSENALRFLLQRTPSGAKRVRFHDTWGVDSSSSCLPEDPVAGSFRVRLRTTGRTMRVSRVEAPRPPMIVFPRVVKEGPAVTSVA